MRDDHKPRHSVLNIIAMALCGWVLVKAAVIGYYPSEVVPQLIAPSAVALGLFWWADRRKEEGD